MCRRRRGAPGPLRAQQHVGRTDPCGRRRRGCYRCRWRREFRECVVLGSASSPAAHRSEDERDQKQRERAREIAALASSTRIVRFSCTHSRSRRPSPPPSTHVSGSGVDIGWINCSTDAVVDNSIWVWASMARIIPPRAIHVEVVAQARAGRRIARETMKGASTSSTTRGPGSGTSDLRTTTPASSNAGQRTRPHCTAATSA